MRYRRLDRVFKGEKIPGKFVKRLGIAVKIIDIKNFFRIIFAGHIKPLRPAEIWDPGVRGDAGSCENSDRFGIGDVLKALRYDFGIDHMKN